MSTHKRWIKGGPEDDLLIEKYIYAAEHNIPIREYLPQFFKDREFNSLEHRIRELRNEKPPRLLNYRYYQREYKVRLLGLDKKPELEAEHIEPIFIDKKQSLVDWRATLQKASEMQKIIKEADPAQDRAKIVIPTDGPIAITTSAEWHMGSLATDHESLIRDLDYFLNVPRTYMISPNDLIDNTAKFFNLKAVHSQVLSPEMQHLVLDEMAKEFGAKHKLLCVGEDNHVTERDEKNIGWSPSKHMFGKHCVFFRGKAKLELVVGGQSYWFLIIHKSRFHSFLNEYHANMREYQLHFPANVVITAHTHNPGFGWFNRYDELAKAGFPIGGDNIFIKAGTYKTDCEYSARYFEQGRLRTPSIVLFPDRKEMVPFMWFNQAVEYMMTEYKEIPKEVEPERVK